MSRDRSPPRGDARERKGPPDISSLFTVKIDGLSRSITWVITPFLYDYFALNLFFVLWIQIIRKEALKEAFDKYDYLLLYYMQRIWWRKCLHRFGEIGDVYIPRIHGSFENRGFGFVRFVDEKDAEDAVKRMDGSDLDGREIRAAVASNKRPEYPPRFYY